MPVDEVVTLTLAYREDDQLARLMLDEQETARLNRLWAEYEYVSQNALLQVDAFEQLWQYATQDADPSVFEPMRKPIAARAAAFRRSLVESEPSQVEAVVRFASKAYRRPLTTEEESSLRELYRTLRKQELSHEEAFRNTLARIFISTPFLYKLEKPPVGREHPSRIERVSRAVPSLRACGKGIAQVRAPEKALNCWSRRADTAPRL